MVALSAAKRADCARAIPLFWRPAADADAKQGAWFVHLLTRDTTIALVHDGATGIDGFLIGLVGAAPPVYDPGGSTLTIDDFCVREPGLWATVGRSLLGRARLEGRARGGVQVVVVCGAHDAHKLAILDDGALRVASHWITGPI